MFSRGDGFCFGYFSPPSRRSTAPPLPVHCRPLTNKLFTLYERLPDTTVWVDPGRPPRGPKEDLLMDRGVNADVCPTVVFMLVQECLCFFCCLKRIFMWKIKEICCLNFHWTRGRKGQWQLIKMSNINVSFKRHLDQMNQIVSLWVEFNKRFKNIPFLKRGFIERRSVLEILTTRTNTLNSEATKSSKMFLIGNFLRVNFPLRVLFKSTF